MHVIGTSQGSLPHSPPCFLPQTPPPSPPLHPCYSSQSGRSPPLNHPLSSPKFVLTPEKCSTLGGQGNRRPSHARFRQNNATPAWFPYAVALLIQNRGGCSAVTKLLRSLARRAVREARARCLAVNLALGDGRPNQTKAPLVVQHLEHLR